MWNGIRDLTPDDIYKEFQLTRERLHELANNVNTWALRATQSDGKLNALADTVKDIRDSQKESRTEYVTRAEFWPVKVSVYGMLGTIFLFVLGWILKAAWLAAIVVQTPPPTGP